jgi:hypothetical protein
MSRNVRSLPIPQESMLSERYSVHLAGRPALREISASAAIWGYMAILLPNPPPLSW